MRDELTQIEYIERYLEGTLSTEEKQAFEEKLALQSELKESVELQRVLTERVKRKAIKNVVKQVHVQRTGKWGNMWLNSFILAVVVAGGIFLYSKLNTTSTPDVVQNTVETPTVSVTTEVKKDSLLNPPSVVTVPQNPSPVKSNAVAPATPVAGTSTTPPAPKVVAPLDKQDFIVPFTQYTFDAQKGITVTDKRSGSTITISRLSLMNKKGMPVTGNVTLSYREYRDAADMAFSGIPMTYKDGNFNSAGMFEIYVVQNKDTLRVHPQNPVIVDFTMTQSVPELSYYELNKSTNSWKELAPMQANDAAFDDVAEVEVPVILAPNTNKVDVFKEKDYIEPGIGKGTISPVQPKYYYYANNRANDLLCYSFGVYNCDQVYRNGKSLSMKPVFRDSTGKVIANQQLIVLIDMKYNGAISYRASTPVILNPAGRNILLLFTTDGKMYAMNEERMKAVKLGTAPELAMEDISDRVTDADDLRAYLKSK